MSKQKFREAFKRYAFFPKTKLPYWTLRKLRSLKSKAVGQKGWADWFDWLVRDVSLEPTIHERIQDGTARSLLNIWMENYANNLPFIRFGDGAEVQIPALYKQKTLADLVKRTPIMDGESDYETTEGPVDNRMGMNVKNPPEGTAVVVGRGPSLFTHQHCKMLRESEYKGLVVASDGGLIPCLEAGVVPDFVVTVDGAPVIKKYFDHPLVTEHGPKMKWITTVTVNHEVYLAARKAGMPAYWFQPMFDDWRENESLTRLQVLMSRTSKFPRGVPRANAGGNAGACAWILAMSLLKRAPIALIGIDFGYPEGTKLEDTQYFSSVMKEAKGDASIVKEAYRQFYHPTFQQKAYCDLVFYHYRQAFIEMQQSVPFWYKLYGGTINCTEGGTLFGQGITCMKFNEFLEKYKN